MEFRFCPSTGGFKSLRSMAYHPATRAFYIPLNLTCEDGTFGPMKLVEGGGGSGPVRRINLMHPGEPRRPWRAARDGRQRKDPVAPSHAHAAEHVGADDGRRARAGGSLGSATSASTTRRPERFSTRARACRRSFRDSRSRTPSTANSTSRCRSAPAAARGRAASSPTRSPRRAFRGDEFDLRVRAPVDRTSQSG